MTKKQIEKKAKEIASQWLEPSDCKCCECGKPAVAFWPVIDPDIPSNPYCRKCLDKAKTELMIKLFKQEKDETKKSKNSGRQLPTKEKEL